MTDHNSGAKDQAEAGGVDGAGANVVPFPRSWYGSVDELVPIDPGPPPDTDRSSSSTDATAFWGGDATQPSGRDSDEVAPESPSVTPNQTRRRRALQAGFALALLVAVTVIVALGGENAPTKGNKAAAAKAPALTVTQTVPRTTTVVQTVTTPKTNTAHDRHPRRREPTAATIDAKQVTSAADSVSHSPTPSRPASNPTSSSVAPAGGGGSSLPNTGSSKPSCAPSITNGGACSL